MSVPLSSSTRTTSTIYLRDILGRIAVLSLLSITPSIHRMSAAEPDSQSRAGGEFDTFGDFLVAIYPGTSETVSFAGDETTFRAKNTWIGMAGDGELHVSDQAYVSVEQLMAGREINSSGIVTVTDRYTTLRAENTFIGSGGRGELLISDQAYASLQSLDVGREVSGIGIVTVTGENTTLRAEGTSIGIGGQGEFNVSQGAEVSLEQFVIGREAGSSGVTTVTGNRTVLRA